VTDQLGAYHTIIMSHSVNLDDLTVLMSISSIFQQVDYQTLY